MSWIKNNKFRLAVALLLIIYLAYRLTNVTDTPALEVKSETYRPVLQMSGEVVLARDSLLSCKNTGQVARIPVKEGQQVAAGQVLLSLDSAEAGMDVEKARLALREYEIKLSQAASIDLQEAEKNVVNDQQALEEAVRELERAQALFAAGGISQQDLQAAQKIEVEARAKLEVSQMRLQSYQSGGSNIGLLKNMVEQKRLELRRAQLNLAGYSIVAPFAGQVLEIQTSQGERVAAGQTLIRLADSNQLEVKVNPDQQYKDLITPGMSARVWLPQEPEMVWNGQVSRVEPSADPALGTLGAYVALEQGSGVIKPGTLVTVQLTAAPAEGILLPDAWLVSNDGQTGTWVDEQGVARFRTLNLGSRGSWGVVIKEGLKPGEIVLEPGELKDGQRVKAILNSGEVKS